MIICTKTHLKSDKLISQLQRIINNPIINGPNNQATEHVKKILKKSDSHSSSSPWWDEECSSLVSERRQISNDLLKNPNIDNLRKLIKIENDTKKKLAKIKKQKFRQFTEEKFSKDTDIKEVWNTIHKFNRSKNTNKFASNDLELIDNSNNLINGYCTVNKP